MKIALSTESAADLTPERLKTLGVHRIPYTIIMGEETVHDGDRPIEDLYKFADETGQLPRTSAINVSEFVDYFENILKDNDAIIHLSLSSGITSSTEHAMEAAKKCSKPIYVIDSKVLSSGISLLVEYARHLIDKGLAPEEIVSKVEARIPYTQVSFVIETLEYLRKGGRCSALTAFAANMFGIKPEIVMTDGKLGSGTKHRGPMKKIVKEYIENTLKNNPNIDPFLCYVTYSTAPQDVLDMACEMVKKASFKEVRTAQAGSTIGTHCGPHTLGILYFADGPHDD